MKRNFIAFSRIIFVVTGILTCLSASGKKLQLAAAEIHADNVYSYALHQPERAYAIIEALKKQGKLSTFDLYRIEGDFHFNRANYLNALCLYKKMLHDPRAKRHAGRKMMVYRRLIPCYRELRNYVSMDYFADLLLDISRQEADTAMLATATFAKGEAAHARGERARGYELMQQAIGMLRHNNFAQHYDQAYLYLMTVANHQQEDSLYSQAGHTLDRIVHTFSRAMHPDGSGREVLTAQRKKDIYAHRTVLAWIKGDDRQSEKWYTLFKTTGNDSTYNYGCLQQYLLERGKETDIQRFVDARKAYLTSVRETLSTEYIDCKRMLTALYTSKGDYRKATECYQKISTIYQRKGEMERRAMMHELTASDELFAQRLSLKRTQLYAMLGIVALVLAMAAAYLRWQARLRRITMGKNQLMAATIDDLMHYKQMFDQRERRTADTTLPTEQCATVADNDADHNRMLYNKVSSYLRQEEVFTRADLTREHLLERFSIPKNLFATLFQQYQGMGYAQYLGTIRLEHAVKLLHEHPEYGIDYVASASGMSVPTLYRLFSQKYGMTPAEYRECAAKNNRPTD